MTTKISSANIQPTGVTAGSYTAANVTVNETGQVVTAATNSLTSIAVPKITSVEIITSDGTVLDDTAVSTSGGYIKINGTGFASGCQVLLGEIQATVTTFLNNTEVRAQIPATTAGTYTLYLVNTDGGVAIRVNGLTSSAFPVWVTGSSLTEETGNQINVQFQASEATNYVLASGSTLPTGVSLSATGLLSGSVNNLQFDTTYSFSVVATDLQNQNSSKTFNLTITTPPDTYFSQVVLLLHADGTNNSTSIVDSSNSARSFTTVGSASISTDIKKFGSGSIKLLGGGNTASFYQSGGSITIANLQAFTVEAWVYLLSSGRHALMGEPGGWAYSTGWGFGIMDTIGPYGTAGSVKGICWMLSPINGYGGNMVWSGQYPTLNTWTHIAICRNSSGNWSFFMDGVKGTTQNSNSQAHSYSQFPANDGPTGAMTFPVYTGNFNGLTSGGNSVGMPAGFNGYIDEFRITVGTNRYTANFTPKVGAFQNR